MNAVDYVLIGLIAAIAVFGAVRGILSQIASLAGIAAAFFVAPLVSGPLSPFIRDWLDTSVFTARKVSILLAAVAVYAAVRIAGYGFEKLFLNRVRELRRLNRLGGAALGAVKGGVLVAVGLFFTALIPRSTLASWAPALVRSGSYRLASRFNPLGDQAFLDRARLLRRSMDSSDIREKLKDSPGVRRLLAEHRMEGALDDERFLRTLREGDFESLRRNEDIEKLMREDQLEELLVRLGNK